MKASDSGKGLQSYQTTQKEAEQKGKEDLPLLEDAEKEQEESVVPLCICANCIEVLDSDPTGDDLFNGRIWILSDYP